MKLRQIVLTNVRRFGSQTATLGPFGDGLTTVTAENEAGKSTFFDALHALFFIAHTSKAAEVRKLHPYSGGPVTVAAEIEMKSGHYRIEKTFLAKVSARVTDLATGQIIKQQGDADQWLETQINATRKGPAGLLWVRQGDADVDPKTKDFDNLAARRDLMSSIRGQIDAVTGGRRMDKIAERCRAEFDALSTQGFKAKAGSPWRQIEDEVVRLTETREKLCSDVAKLSQALKVKSTAAARLRDLQDEATKARRVAQMQDASAAFEEAKAHAANIAKAEAAVTILQAEQEKYARDIKEIASAQQQRQSLADKIAATQARAAKAEADRANADQAAQEAKAKVDAKETARRKLHTRLNAARDAEKRAATWQRLHQIASLKDQLTAPSERKAAAHKILAGPAITRADLDSMTKLSERISIAHARRNASFPRLSFAPTEGAQVHRDKSQLNPDAPLLIDRDMTLDLEGYGQIHLHAAGNTSADIEDPDALTQMLARNCETLGFPDVATARGALTARQDASQALALAEAELRGLAPEGINVLDAEYERLCSALDHDVKAALPPITAPSSQSTETIEAEIATFDATLDHLTATLTTYRDKATETATDAATAAGVLAHQIDEQIALAKPADEDSRLEQLNGQHTAAITQLQTADAERAALAKDGPDLLRAQATFNRLQEADQADRDEIAVLHRQLAHADGAIEAQSEGAVEENLAAVTEALDKAQARSARYLKQARALRLLLDHLDAARKDAQDKYFEPIRQELQPLLTQLHGGAGFELDPDTMLLGQITRNGVTDDVSALSGGAYEQIAILTRLAFARLFAKQGNHVPVILDDALVHTDDARIATMFNMLNRAAADQQIIVLSCRTGAFSDLGGTRAFIEARDI